MADEEKKELETSQVHPAVSGDLYDEEVGDGSDTWEEAPAAESASDLKEASSSAAEIAQKELDMRYDAEADDSSDSWEEAPSVEAEAVVAAKEAESRFAAEVDEDGYDGDDDEPESATVEPATVPAAEPEAATVPAPEPVRVDPKDAPKPAAPAAPKGFPLTTCIIAAVVALVLGFVLGKFLPVGGSAASANSNLAGKTTVAESELDTVLGRYTYNGQTYDLTAREVIETNTSLDAAKTEDGNYTLPSADYVLSSARNAILQREVEAQGISVSDEEVDAYATETVGSSDYASLASQYGMSEDQIKNLLKQSAGMKKLYESVVGSVAGSMPEAPEMYAEGQEGTATEGYYQYIVNLAGDEWNDAEKKWARTDGSYYAALSNEDFSSGTATYSQAETAYYVAYQLYSQTATDSSSRWNDYCNNVLANGTISISTLIS